MWRRNAADRLRHRRRAGMAHLGPSGRAGQAATDFPCSLAAGTDWVRPGVNLRLRSGKG